MYRNTKNPLCERGPQTVPELHDGIVTACFLIVQLKMHIKTHSHYYKHSIKILEISTNF